MQRRNTAYARSNGLGFLTLNQKIVVRIHEGQLNITIYLGSNAWTIIQKPQMNLLKA